MGTDKRVLDKNLNVLSVDWDFFFPDCVGFDWSMDETNSLFYEVIWPIRWSNRNLFTGEYAKDAYLLDVYTFNGFWDRVLGKSDLKGLFVCDSHADMYHLIKFYRATDRKLHIWNFDQHHDIGYFSKSRIDCGNWAGKMRDNISSYHLVYPKWRRSAPEDDFDNRKWPTSVSFGIPSELPKFDAVFVCRSSPWTPSWYDHKWMEFIGFFENNFPRLWKRKAAASYALSPRNFSIEEAELLHKKFIEAKKEVMGRNGTI